VRFLQLSVNPQKHEWEQQMTTSLFSNPSSIKGTIKDIRPIEIRMVSLFTPLEHLWDELAS